MNFKKLALNSIIFSALYNGQVFAQEGTKKLSSRSDTFLSQSSIRMLTYEGALEICAFDVLDKNQKMMEVRNLWAEKYVAMTYELLHYKAKQGFEILKEEPGNKFDLTSIKQKLISMSDDTVSEVFAGQSDKKMKSICKDIQKNSMKEASEVFYIFDTVEQQILADMYGPYKPNTDD